MKKILIVSFIIIGSFITIFAVLHSIFNTRLSQFDEQFKNQFKTADNEYACYDTIIEAFNKGKKNKQDVYLSYDQYSKCFLENKSFDNSKVTASQFTENTFRISSLMLADPFITKEQINQIKEKNLSNAKKVDYDESITICNKTLGFLKEYRCNEKDVSKKNIMVHYLLDKSYSTVHNFEIFQKHFENSQRYTEPNADKNEILYPYLDEKTYIVKNGFKQNN